MNSHTKPLYTLSIAAELLGVHQRTLMLYEAEEILAPFRTDTNRRRYSQADIEKLKFVRYLTQALGINLAGVRHIFRILSSYGNEQDQNLVISEWFPDYTPEK